MLLISLRLLISQILLKEMSQEVCCLLCTIQEQGILSLLISYYLESLNNLTYPIKLLFLCGVPQVFPQPHLLMARVGWPPISQQPLA